MGFDMSIDGELNDQISISGIECAWVASVRVRGLSTARRAPDLEASFGSSTSGALVGFGVSG